MRGVSSSASPTSPPTTLRLRWAVCYLLLALLSTPFLILGNVDLNPWWIGGTVAVHTIVLSLINTIVDHCASYDKEDAPPPSDLTDISQYVAEANHFASRNLYDVFLNFSRSGTALVKLTTSPTS